MSAMRRAKVDLFVGRQINPGIGPSLEIGADGRGVGQYAVSRAESIKSIEFCSSRVKSCNGRLVDQVDRVDRLNTQADRGPRLEQRVRN